MLAPYQAHEEDEMSGLKILATVLVAVGTIGCMTTVSMGGTGGGTAFMLLLTVGSLIVGLVLFLVASAMEAGEKKRRREAGLPY